ncbi:MAG: SRPBCC family protein [Betaproteobacteria bacterium]|nr:SRPBCC family protein [Betaproteobacteria bacterium]
MRKPLLFAATAVVVLLVALLAYVMTRPDVFRVQRSTVIAAPAEKLYPLVNELRAWAAWSPYEKRDPGMRRTFSGASSGKGAVYAWAGNKDVGAGRMEILEATPSSRILIKLDFLEPFEGHNTAEFTFEPGGAAGTRVTWAMYGPNAYLTRVMGLIFDMDEMIGRDFATGLANLKAVAEK